MLEEDAYSSSDECKPTVPLGDVLSAADLGTENTINSEQNSTSCAENDTVYSEESSQRSDDTKNVDNAHDQTLENESSVLSDKLELDIESPTNEALPENHETNEDEILGSQNEKEGNEELDPLPLSELDKNNEELEEEDTGNPLHANSENLIADIFGDSEGEEEFEGFEKRGRVRRIEDDDDEEDVKPNVDDNEVEREESQPLYSKEEDEEKEDSEKGEASQTEATGDTNAEAALPELSSDESGDESTRKRKLPEDFVYDFDIMMQKRKESYRRRKRKNVDSIINDSDDVIAELIQEMKQAAEDDFQLNKDRKAATRKLKLLPVVDSQLRKIDLREAFLDAGVLSVITDWLTPLPDRSLPNLQVRETLIKLLSELNIMDVERLKASGIGKAIMYLFKHPKETKENKRRAGQLIATWARPIFNLDSDFHSMSKEEREQRDFEHMTKTKRRMSDVNEGTPSRLKTSEEKAVRPGEKGWIPRARVPMPSTRDYVIRPKSSVEMEATRGGNKKAVTRLDKYLRTFREKKKQSKVQRAVPISIEGRKMSL